MKKPDVGYERRAQVIRVVDGDTVILDIDNGFNQWLRNERCRLIGIDAPEPRGPTRQAGLDAKHHLEKMVEQYAWNGSGLLLIESHQEGKGKWNRWLVELFGNRDGEVFSMNRSMVEDGHAEVYV